MISINYQLLASNRICRQMGERCKLTQQCISFINNLFRWSGFGLLLILLLLLFKILGFRNQSGINRFDLIN